MASLLALPHEMHAEIASYLLFPDLLRIVQGCRALQATYSPLLDRLLPAFIPTRFVTTDLPAWTAVDNYALRNILLCPRVTHVKEWVGVMWKETIDRSYYADPTLCRAINTVENIF